METRKNFLSLAVPDISEQEVYRSWCSAQFMKAAPLYRELKKTIRYTLFWFTPVSIMIMKCHKYSSSIWNYQSLNIFKM